MEKPSSPCGGSLEVQCVGRLEIVKHKPAGFLCGSIPVPVPVPTIDDAFPAPDAALVPSPSHTVRAPRYRMIPIETDLNTLPLLSTIPDKMLPIPAVAHSRTTTGAGELPWQSGAIMSNLTRKGEALAVSGLVEYGDEIDVIAPADILKQIFKMPYSRARLSIAVHRVGQTLILNTGPDFEEGEKIIRRRNNQSKCADHSLFLNFAMHSVRMEACDCPPTRHAPSEEQPDASVLPRQCESKQRSFGSSDNPNEGHYSQVFGLQDDLHRAEDINHKSEYPQIKQDKVSWGRKKNKINKGHDAIKRDSQVKEKSRSPVQESERYRRVSGDGFLRVLFWQFNNFRMLLGSDLLIFSNEKYVAVSLHLWDVSRKVTPLTWLEAWLDNIMASVPELAVCYHENGVVQGYELLKTDDIFLVKGISEDGSPAFHPHVVKHNGLSVLRFLQENCKQDPGAYWLYKSAGEDVIQLFDLSVIPKNHSSHDSDDRSSSLPSIVHSGRSDSLLSLGMLLYRIAHRLSFSMSSSKRAKCARFFRKCFEFLDEPDLLVVRALAHEQFARLLLNYDEDMDLTSEAYPTESEVQVTEAEEEAFEYSCSSDSIFHKMILSPVEADEPDWDAESFRDSEPDIPMKSLDPNLALRTVITSSEENVGNNGDASSCADQSSVFSEMTTASTQVVQTSADPISSKLAAIHHVSQAIKFLRWKRQLQGTKQEQNSVGGDQDKLPLSINFLVCACGDADCIEVCDIREWLPTSKLDDKLWKLVLLLGESYLALAQAYKDDGKLHHALKVLELACLVYGSMPQHLEDSRFISSMVCSSPTKVKLDGRIDRPKPFVDGPTSVDSCTNDGNLSFEQYSSPYLFWAKTWALVGDVYVEFHMVKGNEISTQTDMEPSKELKMSSEVLKEVQRLKKKLGPFNQNCTSCSLVNCSCQNDRANSGSSASSSTGETHASGYGRKHGKKSHLRNSPYHCTHEGNREDGRPHCKVEYRNSSDTVSIKNSKVVDPKEACGSVMDSQLEPPIREIPNAKCGGVFKYLGGPVIGDGEYNLSAALSCYEEARKALGGQGTCSAELLSIHKKKGWVCNELGRKWLDRKQLEKAELAFSQAIDSFKEVSDHNNIILINCNLGHGRRALAEEMVAKMESLKKNAIFHNASNHALESAKLEYSESLRYYGAAKAELNAISEDIGSTANSLRNEVSTQFAHTYLRLGMLLAREDTVADVYENGVLESFSSPGIRRNKNELWKHEISANDAIREALSVYESLGELRKQEAAYAYFQLACYQKDCCLKFLELDQKKSNMRKGENSVHQRVKQYLSLAERNWQKSIDFYGPKTHPVMYLTILLEKATLSFSLSSYFNSNMMLESALSYLLEGREISEDTTRNSLDSSEIYAKFWSQLQMVLKRMLAMTLPGSDFTKYPSNRSGDVTKLREIYKMSLKSTDLCQLHAMYKLWTWH